MFDPTTRLQMVRQHHEDLRRSAHHEADRTTRRGLRSGRRPSNDVTGRPQLGIIRG